MKKLVFVLSLSSCFVACTSEESGGHDHGDGEQSHRRTPANEETAGHGDAVSLGSVTLAGHEFAITRLGEVKPGEEAAFEVSFAGGSKGSPLTGVSVFLWVETQSGERLSPSAKGDIEGHNWHVHALPKKGGGDPHRVVLRVRAGGKDERAALPLSGHGHEHGDSPHHGIVALLRGPGGKEAGHVELKLHDDKGDLELWLAKDAKISAPFDLPLDGRVRVTFIDHDDREVTLAVRNDIENEDEEGTPNIRSGKTNYFIFPGDTGADASWLVGKEFQSIVKITFENGGKTYSSEEFVLVPHTH